MIDPIYPVARVAAARALPRMAGHDDVLPSLAVMQEIVNAGFWASLRREEGFATSLSLAYVDPSQVRDPLFFEVPIPLDPQALARIAPAVERPGIHLGVWGANGSLAVWGATPHLPAFSFVLEVVAPGLLVLKQSPAGQPGKFVNITVLQGDEVRVIDPRATAGFDCPRMVSSLLGLDAHVSSDSTNVLIRLAVSMRAHRRGGLLLVVPQGTDAWRESLLRPIKYGVVPAFSALADLVRADHPAEYTWRESMRRAIDGIAGLTAVDGATILTNRYELLAFGAKIVRRAGAPQAGSVILTEPVEGSMPEAVDPSQLGGTRHLYAAQFAQDQRDSVALVASQDGRFTVFAWSPCENKVHAHRIDALLM